MLKIQGEAEGIKPVIYGILYYRRRWVYYFSPFRVQKWQFSLVQREQNCYFALAANKNIFHYAVWKVCFPAWQATLKFTFRSL